MRGQSPWLPSWLLKSPRKSKFHAPLIFVFASQCLHRICYSIELCGTCVHHVAACLIAGHIRHGGVCYFWAMRWTGSVTQCFLSAAPISLGRISILLLGCPLSHCLLLYALHDPVTWVLEGLALKRHLCGFAVALCVWLVYVICKQHVHEDNICMHHFCYSCTSYM